VPGIRVKSCVKSLPRELIFNLGGAGKKSFVRVKNGLKLYWLKFCNW
jgi:hypothetical protein